MRSHAIPPRFAIRVLPAILVLATLAASITRQSLWIDELTSAWLAAQSSWSGVIAALSESGSEAQMPLFVVWLWNWARLAGTGEWALRASNLPWAMVAVASWVALTRRWKCPPAAIVLMISPFLGYYMNEARPYMLTFAGAALALAGAEVLASTPGGAPRRGANSAILAGTGLCVGASMLNVAVLPALAAYAALRLVAQEGCPGGQPWLARIRAHGALLGLLVVELGAFGLYYGFTWWQGHGGQREGFSIANMAFAAYEMLGFGGLGAPRILIRSLTLRQVLSHYGWTLGVGLAVWVGVLLTVWPTRKAWRSHPVLPALAAALLAGVSTLVAAAWLCRASLWGRHFMAAYPFVMGLLACLLTSPELPHPAWRRAALGALAALFLVSLARQCVLPSYAKDPLREGIRQLDVLQRQDARPVLFLAYDRALWYYGESMLPGMAIAPGWGAEQGTRWDTEHPSYRLFMHRPDKFDPTGLWQQRAASPGASVEWRQGNVTIYTIDRPQSPGTLP